MGAPLDSGGIRAADNGAHKRTRDRHQRNPHFVQRLQSQDLRNSACAAAALLKTRGARDIRFVCLLAAPEGIAHFQKEHPDVPVWTAAVDERLNDHGYILPGLGDAGDRMFGTK